MYYTYIIRTQGGFLYTGIARDLFRRMAQHAAQGKKSAKFTRSRKVEALEALWSSPDRASASRLEWAVKALSKKQKEALILRPRLFSQLFPGLEQEDYVRHPKACLDLYLKQIPLSRLP